MASTLASHQVKVTVVEAQNVMRTNDWNEGSDAYCEIKLHGKAHEGTPLKTSTQKQSLSPKWNETFTVELSHSPMNDTIEIFCYGEKVLGKLFIGRVEIPVTLLLHGAMVDGWFKLLPLSVADLSKTVQGHLHLILHYSQVQVPVPAKPVEKSVKKPSTTSASVYPGTTSSMVDCPICSRSFSALAINAHLDICTQTPAPPPSKQPQQQQKSEVRACPVCCKTYPVADLNRHVEQCLASQPALPEPKKEKKKKKKKSVRGPASESEENAQLQAVLIASKLEAEKNEKEKRRDTPTETPYIVDTPPSSSPSSGYQPFYPSVPFMPYSATSVPPAAPYVPYGLPTQPTDPSTDGQQPPLAYFPPMPMGMPMYPPPFYGAPTQPPMMPYTPMMPTSSPTTPTQPKNENLLL